MEGGGVEQWGSGIGGVGEGGREREGGRSQGQGSEVSLLSMGMHCPWACITCDRY